jgi:hypothetical protein
MVAVSCFDYGCLDSCILLKTGINAPATGEYCFRFQYLDACVEIKQNYQTGEEILIDLSSLNESYCFVFEIIDPNNDVLQVVMAGETYAKFKITTKIGCATQASGVFTTVPSGGGDAIEYPTQHIGAKVAIFDGALASDAALANEPKNGTDVPVFINGKKVIVGDGVKTNCSIYFSGDNGLTARSFTNTHPNGKIQLGDKLYVNPSFHEYSLDTLDTISIGGFIAT